MSLDRPRPLTSPHSVESDDGELTTKMELFVTNSLSGMSDVAAYRAAYDCEGMTDQTIGRRAHEVAHHPIVKAKIKRLIAERNSATTLAPFLTREWILNGVAHLAQYASKEAVQLNAYKLLGQTVGIDLFRETTVVERRQRSPEEIDAELRRRLDELAITIDGQATRQAPAVTQQPTDRRRKPAK